MKPVKKVINYEKVVIGDFIKGVIEDIERDEKHESTYQGKQRISDCIRFSFRLEGYTYLHKSNWMSFSYGSKSNLYTKYLTKLVENAKPDMEFDILLLKGLKVKTLWSETEYQGKTYQHVENIFPLTEKVKILEHQEETSPEEEPPVDEGSFDTEAPF